MNHPPRLLAEDRADFDRLLDEALRDPAVRQALAEPGVHLNTEQLRTRVLAEAETVAAPAAAEYAHYLELRAAAAEQRPDGAPPVVGAGLLPALTVLTPLLAGSTGLILLVLGWLLRVTAPGLAFGRAAVTAGLLALAVAAAALLIGGAGLILTARRGATRSAGADPYQQAELAAARAAWHTALRDRALLPWLLAHHTATPGTGVPRPRTSTPDLHSPGYSRAGYGSPGFTSPGADGLTDDQGRSRPAGFTGPGHSSPDFTGPGPEHLTDADGRPRPDGPRYTAPDFTSPGREGLTDDQGRRRPAGFTRPGHHSPDFTGPGPEHLTDADGRPRPDGPRYTAPDFTSPGPEGLTDGHGRPRPAGGAPDPRADAEDHGQDDD
ncbi:hypothetical protein [Kitasatospora griseola]|uniref:hypothetical protein n=1 Tax=Kitasatospora griseola TaxID=2064 RepID=UPI0016714872|nr:hypothetical protein [Kitasatospora griseola]GGQ71631.1 hypothetical protein GCM10010195_29080 [Kitasatospora griseola]